MGCVSASVGDLFCFILFMITFVWHLAQQPFRSSWRKEDRRIAVQLLVSGFMATVCGKNLVQQIKAT